MPTIMERISHGWNAFMNKDPTGYYLKDAPSALDNSFYIRPDRPRFTRGNERSIVTSVYNRIAMDCASIAIEHVRLDENNRFVEVIDSSLNSCLTLSANRDQTSRAFMQDVVMSMFDEGCIAIFPTDVDVDPLDTNSYDILEWRTAKITAWYPYHVRIQCYNENTCKYETLVVPKSKVSIVENPFYAVMNEPNSTLQRLIRKLVLLDQVDEQSGSGKLDLIIQLPYVIKSDARREQANKRRSEIEQQLAGTKYGIAYTDGTEKITQLNRSVDNQLMNQIEYLTQLLYSQLGITTAILDGTADEKTMLNYNNRTIEPILSAIVDEMKRKFLTKTARTQKQSIMFFREPFKLVPVNELASIGDSFTRNEIMSSNEMRQVLGMKPINDPKADELRNKNLNVGDGQEFASTSEEIPDEEYGGYEDTQY